MRRQLPPHVPRNHPVVSQHYAVFTPPINEFVDHVANWIDRQVSGYVWGFSRFGKTRAVTYFLQAMLRERFGHVVPLLIFTRVSYRRLVSPHQFWEALLRAGGRKYPDSRSSLGRRLQLVVDMLLSMAAKCSADFAVIVIDEAQAMKDDEWRLMVGLQNALEEQNVRLSVISVGSHQMGYVHDVLAVTGDAHCAARFLVRSARFPGLRNVEDLRFAMNGYDEDSEWPRGSGASYTASLAPDAFSDGFRISASAPMLFNALEELLPPSYAGIKEFPMEHVALAIEEALLRVAAGEDLDHVSSAEEWIRIVERTDFTEYMRLISAHAGRRTRLAA
jgi:hypothetical protein